MSEQQYEGRIENIFVFPFNLVQEEFETWSKLSPRVACHLSELLAERNVLFGENEALREAFDYICDDSVEDVLAERKEQIDALASIGK